jgi:hypothetical protein
MFIKQNKKIENLSVYWFHNKKSFTQRKIKRSLPRALEEKKEKDDESRTQTALQLE